MRTGQTKRESLETSPGSLTKLEVTWVAVKEIISRNNSSIVLITILRRRKPYFLLYAILL